MNYLIDANNLAGSLGILKENSFDELLVNKISAWLKNKNNIIVLVFDSLDGMGDKKVNGNIVSVYTPRDSYYTSADDKILEIAGEWFEFLNDEEDLINKFVYSFFDKDCLVVVSDDIEIRLAVENIKQKSPRIKLLRNEKFIQLVENNTVNVDFCPKKELDSDSVNRINNELLEIWTKKNSQ